MTTSRSARRALVMLAGFAASASVLAQSPYQPNRAAGEPSVMAVAVPDKNAPVPTFTFQRAEPVSQTVAATVVVPAVATEVRQVHAVALPIAPVPTVVFQAVGESAAPVAQPVVTPPTGYNTSQRPVRIAAPVVQPQVVRELIARQEIVAAPIVQVTMQGSDPTTDDSFSLKDLGIEVDPPKGDRLFRLESETALRKRISEERRTRPSRGLDVQVDTEFPTYAPLTDKAFEARTFAAVAKQIEPNYVIYGRLYAEEMNAERYGWDMGAIQPFWSSAMAFKDMAMIPYNFAARPCQCYETSAGRCYPGDPVPYMIYPLELSVTGAAWETVVILGAFAIIP